MSSITEQSHFKYDPADWEVTQIKSEVIESNNLASRFLQETSENNEKSKKADTEEGQTVSYQPTCVLKGQSTVGPYEAKPDGTPSEKALPEGYTDFDYWNPLVKFESQDFSYRLNQVQLCTNENGDLVGMQSFIGQYSNTTRKLLKTQAMPEVGNMRSGTCEVLNVDPMKNEYVSNLAIRYGSEKVDAMAVQTNTGNVIFAGNFPTEYQDKFRTFWADEPLVGFFGQAGEDAIYQIGEVVVETNCIKLSGDPFSPHSEQGIIVSQREWNKMTGLNQNQTIAIAAGTFFVLAMLIGGLVWIYCWMRGKRQQGMKVTTLDQNYPQEGRRSVKKAIELHDASADIGNPSRKMSVKRGRDGKMEIHQELAQEQYCGTDLEIQSVNDDNKSGKFDLYQNTDKDGERVKSDETD